MTALPARQCTLCGRRGTRYFTALGLGLFACTYTRACERRRQAFFAPRMRRKETA